jgi:hypothetical protein
MKYMGYDGMNVELRKYARNSYYDKYSQEEWIYHLRVGCCYCDTCI